MSETTFSTQCSVLPGSLVGASCPSSVTRRFSTSTRKALRAGLGVPREVPDQDHRRARVPRSGRYAGPSARSWGPSPCGEYRPHCLSIEPGARGLRPDAPVPGHVGLPGAPDHQVTGLLCDLRSAAARPEAARGRQGPSTPVEGAHHPREDRVPAGFDIVYVGRGLLSPREADTVVGLAGRTRGRPPPVAA